MHKQSKQRCLNLESQAFSTLQGVRQLAVCFFQLCLVPKLHGAAVKKQVTEQVGTEVVSFTYGNALKGLNTVANASKVPVLLSCRKSLSLMLLKYWIAS